MVPKHNLDLVRLMVSNGTRCITKYNAEYYEERTKRRDIRKDAGLKLYYKKVEKIMRQSVKVYDDDEIRVGVGAPIYLTGCLDVILDKIIVAAEKFKTTRGVICVDSIVRGIQNDLSLKLLFCEVFA